MAVSADFLAKLVDLVKKRYGSIEEQPLKEYLDVVDSIQTRKSGIDWERKRCEEQYRKDVESLQKKLDQLQEECPHYVTDFGYECTTRTTVCLICGQEKPYYPGQFCE